MLKKKKSYINHKIKHKGNSPHKLLLPLIEKESKQNKLILKNVKEVFSEIKIWLERKCRKQIQEYSEAVFTNL